MPCETAAEVFHQSAFTCRCIGFNAYPHCLEKLLPAAADQLEWASVLLGDCLFDPRLKMGTSNFAEIIHTAQSQKQTVFWQIALTPAGGKLISQLPSTLLPKVVVAFGLNQKSSPIIAKDHIRLDTLSVMQIPGRPILNFPKRPKRLLQQGRHDSTELRVGKVRQPLENTGGQHILRSFRRTQKTPLTFKARAAFLAGQYRVQHDILPHGYWLTLSGHARPWGRMRVSPET